jgi:hypothetical protein
VTVCHATKAESNWTSENTDKQLAFTVLEIVDLGQTLYTSDLYDDRHEINPFLGRYPSKDKITRYFAICIVGNAIIAYLLPPKWRDWWQNGSIGLEVIMVTNNIIVNEGLKVSFNF